MEVAMSQTPARRARKIAEREDARAARGTMLYPIGFEWNQGKRVSFDEFKRTLTDVQARMEYARSLNDPTERMKWDLLSAAHLVQALAFDWPDSGTFTRLYRALCDHQRGVPNPLLACNKGGGGVSTSSVEGTMRVRFLAAVEAKYRHAKAAGQPITLPDARAGFLDDLREALPSDVGDQLIDHAFGGSRNPKGLLKDWLEDIQGSKAKWPSIPVRDEHAMLLRLMSGCQEPADLLQAYRTFVEICVDEVRSHRPA
jgi:hypothetical protein